jgi:hypothetical protein
VSAEAGVIHGLRSRSSGSTPAVCHGLFSPFPTFLTDFRAMVQWTRLRDSDNSFGVKCMRSLHLCAAG